MRTLYTARSYISSSLSWPKSAISQRPNDNIELLFAPRGMFCNLRHAVCSFFLELSVYLSQKCSRSSLRSTQARPLTCRRSFTPCTAHGALSRSTCLVLCPIHQVYNLLIPKMDTFLLNLPRLWKRTCHEISSRNLSDVWKCSWLL